MREEQGMGEESEGTVGLGLWVWRGVVGVGSLPFGKLRTGFGRLRTGFARLRAGSLRTGEGTKGGLRGRRAGLRRRPVPFDRGRKTGASGTPAVGRTRGVGRLLGRPWVRSGPGPVARKTGGSETPPLQKRRGRGVVGETLRRRDTWADCGEWLRVDSRHEDTGWPNRRTLRLQGYDYSQAGAYAVTICTHDGAFLFGYVADGAMHLSAAGRVVERVWDGLPGALPARGVGCVCGDAGSRAWGDCVGGCAVARRRGLGRQSRTAGRSRRVDRKMGGSGTRPYERCGRTTGKTGGSGTPPLRRGGHLGGMDCRRW